MKLHIILFLLVVYFSNAFHFLKGYNININKKILNKKYYNNIKLNYFNSVKEDTQIDNEVDIKKNNDFLKDNHSINYKTLLPIPFVLFGGYEFANAAGGLLLDPSKSSFIAAYWRYFLSGAISASFAHLVTVPFDVVKTKIQLEKDTIGIIDMGKKIIDDEGPKGLLSGKNINIVKLYIFLFYYTIVL